MMTTKDPVLVRIQELIPLAPSNWAEIAAREMGKSTNSIYAYSTGRRGMKKGYHKEVLRIINRLVEEEQAEIKKLIKN